MSIKRSSQLKKIVKRYWRSRFRNDMRFLTASSEDSSDLKYDQRMHFHNTFTVSALEDGSLPVSFHNGTVLLRPGEILVIGHNIPHRVELVHLDGACYYRTATINEELLSRTLLLKIKDMENTVSRISDSRIWENFITEQKKIEVGSEELGTLSSIYEMMLAEISNNVLMRFEVSSPYIRSVLKYVEENYLQPLNLEDLANYVNLSLFHFTRLFKKEVGMSPHAYITQLRVNRAQDLIQYGESLLGIAYELGFADQSHFSRTFLKLTGVSPVRFNIMSKN
ncbi:MAG: AraC family transcriptional regulator [Synergistes jonesii]|uniref:AraC family transcriptional regulator n=1 Tax=Synergistes jonesii TaxID=2754 RepID=UPI002A762BA5|nr:AraC family transcriptional regulator [Synergistes jonesii]MDY2984311.1 AraC family transcriptional regulator [Synergistes jonesii]